MKRLVLAAVIAASSWPAWAADPCDGRMPWKSAGAVQYPDSALRPFYDLARQMHDAYAGGRLADADRLATQYLALAPNFRCDWNHGNAVHDAHAVLGLIALQRGDRAGAAGHLVAAGQSRGSPQLDSFGPSLMLARRLAEAGEFAAVATYVRGIRQFWEAKDDRLWCYVGLCDPAPMATWLEQLDRRRVPDFGMNARKSP